MRTQKPNPVTASRSQVLRGEKRIAWFFEKKRAVKRQSGSTPHVIQSAWASESDVKNPGLSLFYVTSKRDIHEAHDRKKLKRWMREAVRRSEGLAATASSCRANRKRMYLMLRVRAEPGKIVNWNSILHEVIEVGNALRVVNSPNRALPVLKKKGVEP